MKKRECEESEFSRYYDEKFELHDCEIHERNGNLYYVRDTETGELSWRCGFELN